jgi:hypothetical protein
MAGPPFEIELLLGGGVAVPIKLSERMVEAARDPAVRAAIAHGDREGLRRGAVEILYAAVMRNDDRPLTVDDGETVWLIPTHAIQAVRLRDSTVAPGEQHLGFRPDRYAMSDELR